MDGLWSGGNVALEQIRQGGITREQLKRFNLSNLGMAADDASYAGGADPNLIDAGGSPPPVGTPMQGGPHYVLSPQTAEGTPTFGVQLVILDGTVSGAWGTATPMAGGYTVTLWQLIVSAQIGQGVANWAKLAPITGIFAGDLLHTFDINASALRVQIENFNDPNVGTPGATGSITVAFAEL